MGGYTAAKKEFESSLRKITMLGYGLVLIAHSATRIEKTAEGSEIEIIFPEMPKRAAEICNGLVDIIGYIGGEYDADKNYTRYLYTRETPTLFAGSRFKYLAPKIKFGYQELVDAIGESIDMEQKLDGAQVVDHTTAVIAEKLDYNQLMQEARDLWVKLVGEGDDANEEMAKRVLKRVEMIFGHPTKISEITEDQVDLLQLVVVDMRDLLG